MKKRVALLGAVAEDMRSSSRQIVRAITALLSSKEARMDRGSKRRLVLAPMLLTVFLVAAAPLATADWVTQYGCLKCNERTVLTFARDFCSQVGHEETGHTACTEFADGLQTHCFLGGSPCFNVEVIGGGGGGAGGGGCVYQAGGYCPAECPSCSGGTGYWL